MESSICKGRFLGNPPIPTISNINQSDRHYLVLMRNRLRSNKVIDIALSEEKFYFPGDIIRGAVLVKPKSSTKVNSIHIKFSGTIHLQAKEKELISLFHVRENIPVYNDIGKLLESKEYRFPFEFSVPENLPSAMDLDMKKMFKVDYKLEAILDRPMVPESLCPQVAYPVLILECIDVTKEPYIKPLEEQKLFVLPDDNKCHVKLSLPRIGYTRGETIPVNLIINTSQSFVCKKAIVIDLVRKMETNTGKNHQKKEHILKSEKLDLNIIGPYNFSQSITTQLLVRTTPPSLKYREKLLSVSYVIRIQVYGKSLKKKPRCLIELPIVIGTWPRAAVPIDEDDEDILQYMGELMVGDEIDEDDGPNNQKYRHNEDKDEDLHWTMDSHRTEQDFELRKGSYLHQPMRRSGSNGSLRSNSSWVTSNKVNHRLSTHIPDAYLMTQGNTATPSHHRNSMIPTLQNIKSPPPPQIGFQQPTEYLNRSSSTPSLFHHSASPQQNARIRESAVYTQYHDSSIVSTSPHASVSSRSHYTHSHRSSISHSSPPQQQIHRRVVSDGLASISSDTQVPSHTLTFIAGAPTFQSQTTLIAEEFGFSSQSDSDDEDEGDLLAIIQKKQRKRQQRQTLTAVA
ncbi:hypothetical protein BD560DRAFT_438176 [Blakeslea trispora]|nr:hypothetical protein BD560DRAFT_438176 [Blakeslea trispora]